jgi:hypothetical protein
MVPRVNVLSFLHACSLRCRDLWFGKACRPAEAYHTVLTPFLPLDTVQGGAGHRCKRDVQGQALETTRSFGLLTLRNGHDYLVPLTSRRAAAAALTLDNPQTLQAHLGRRFLGIGLRLGVRQPFLRRVRLPVSRVGQHRTPQAPLLTHLQGLLGQSDLTYAISLGAPGPHRTPVVQMMDTCGRILAYAKVGYDATSNALVQNEARVLQALAPARWQAFTLPQVLATDWWQDSFLCVLSAPPPPGGRVPARLTPLHLMALHELWTMQAVWRPLPASPFWLTLTQRVRQVNHAYYRSILEQGMASAERWLARTALPFRFCHGDFTPWNLQRDGQKLRIVNWECAADTGPPLWDLCHFMFQTLSLVEQWDAGRICRALVGGTPRQWPIASALRGVGLPDMPLQPLVLLYCIERLAFWARTEPCQVILPRTLSTIISLLDLEL